jgi:hypothetical protein
MRTLKIVRDALAVVGVVAILAGICIFLYHESRAVMSFPWVWQEKGRMASPSGNCEVVTCEGNRGAMSSFAYVCFLVKPDEKVDPNNCDYYEPVFSSSHVLPKVEWKNSNQLVINTEGGYVTHERPYSREFKVAIEFQNEPLSPQWSEVSQ